MNLILRFRDVLLQLSGDLVSELNQMRLRINSWAEAEHNTDGTHAAITISALTFNGETQTTVGAAGGASALPATPLGYLVVSVPINGVPTSVVVPYYQAS